MKKLIILPLVVLAVALFMTGCEKVTEPVDSLEAYSPDVNSNTGIVTCAATPGYWKNHPDAWPVESITIGTNTYSKAEAIIWLGSREKGDKTITLFRAFVAGILNIYRGSDATCIVKDLTAARDWLEIHPVGSGVHADTDPWQMGGEALYLKIDDYNNGLLCAPACD